MGIDRAMPAQFRDRTNWCRPQGCGTTPTRMLILRWRAGRCLATPSGGRSVTGAADDTRKQSAAQRHSATRRRPFDAGQRWYGHRAVGVAERTERQSGRADARSWRKLRFRRTFWIGNASSRYASGAGTSATAVLRRGRELHLASVWTVRTCAQLNEVTPASARSGCAGSSARAPPCPRYTPRPPSAPRATSPARPRRSGPASPAAPRGC